MKYQEEFDLAKAVFVICEACDKNNIPVPLGEKALQFILVTKSLANNDRDFKNLLASMNELKKIIEHTEEALA